MSRIGSTLADLVVGGGSPSNAQQQGPAPGSNAHSHTVTLDNNGQPARPARGNCCTLSYYQAFFDISSKEAGIRVLRALVPFGPVFYPSASDVSAPVASDAAAAAPSDAEIDPSSASPQQPSKYGDTGVLPEPDLYCPFWIVTTLIFVLAITGNLVDYLNNTADGLVWTYDFEKVSLAATTFYFSCIIFPICVYFALKKLNARRPLTNIISLYGYSFAIYIPICPICAIPVPYINLAGVCLAWFCSALFLTRNIYSYFLSAAVPQDNAEEVETHKKTGIVLMIAIAAVHFGIACVTYFYFFSW